MSTLSTADTVINLTVCQYAQLVKAASRNGMSRGGTHRVIGELPADVYYELAARCEARGEPLTGDALRAYLRGHPEYRTVQAVDTGSKGQIRVNA